jgi:hypothetical protein
MFTSNYKKTELKIWLSITFDVEIIQQAGDWEGLCLSLIPYVFIFYILQHHRMLSYNILKHEGGIDTFLRNVGYQLQDYMVSQPRRPESKHWTLFKWLISCEVLNKILPYMVDT